MLENELSGAVIDFCYHIHKELGPGLFESVYEEIMNYELINSGYAVLRQHPIPVIWKGIQMDIGFRSDLIVNSKVLIEIKSVETIANVHKKQVLTYLRLTNLKLGLLINFNESLLKDGITRVVNKIMN